MTRTLSTQTQSAEQYVTFTAAEAIQAGDIVALGYNDGKAYYLTDPATSDTAANKLRNFSLANKPTPTQFKAVSSAPGFSSIGGNGWAKTAQLSNGNTVIVFSSAPPTAYANTSASGVNAAYGLNFTIVDANGTTVVGLTAITGNWTAVQPPSTSPANVYSNPAATGVTVLALPGGGFAVSYADWTNTGYSNLWFKVFSNAGVLASSANIASATVYTYASNAVPYFKMALLSNGNLVFVGASGQYNIYDNTNTLARQSAVTAYNHYYAIYTPAGLPVVGWSVVGGVFNAAVVNAAQSAGAWVGTRHFSTQLLTFPNGNWALTGVQVDYGYSVPSAVTRALVCHMMSNAGVLVGQSRTVMNSTNYVTSGSTAISYAAYEGYVLGCVLSSGSALLHAGGYDTTAFIYGLSQTGGVTLLRNGLNAYLDGVDAGDAGIYGVTVIQNAFFDLYPYGMYPFGSGALLVTKPNEQILNNAGATLATASAIGSGNKPMATASPVRWQISPVIMTTNFGQFMTVQAASYVGGQVPIVPITSSAFGTPITLTIPGDIYVKTIISIPNPQATTANCYQVVGWDRAGYVNTYAFADAIQGMTFVGVAKAAATGGMPVLVQTSGQAKLRISISQPMIVDTRRLLDTAPTGQQGTVLQGNTFGTLATLFGDTATLKGNA